MATLSYGIKYPNKPTFYVGIGNIISAIVELWKEYFKLELSHVDKIKARRAIISLDPIKEKKEEVETEPNNMEDSMIEENNNYSNYSQSDNEIIPVIIDEERSNNNNNNNNNDDDDKRLETIGNDWKRLGKTDNIDISQEINDEYLAEITRYIECKVGFSYLIDLRSQGIFDVIEYAIHGSLHNFQRNLNNSGKELLWKRKIDLLYNISHGLESVHHNGNILVLQQYEAVIGDLGLCKSETSVDIVTCIVISYMVTEVLRGDKYFWNDRQSPFSGCDGYL
ncbi:hypothetical protein Glove_86g177 [Diversispora epigaea]|uniref:Protein kinase domain-containing protein n=1 Tax=Diversispora epigaea TaxID=1348612 RepID=A0A397JGG9_9GLOM|nr:hypothetical protein Glove_86g177 [Diversispora epigaea]